MNFPTKWTPKYLTEALCSQQTFAPDDATRDAISSLLDVLAVHRPVNNAGKHGELHTLTCGCEDVATVNDPKELTVEYGEGIRMSDKEFEAFMRAAKND